MKINNQKNEFLSEKGIAICFILAILVGIIAIYLASGMPDKIKLKAQNQCYEKVFNDSSFLPLKEIKDANKTFIYCDNEWGLCICKFYLGKGLVIYKDSFFKWEMPNLKEVQKEDGGGTET